MSYCSSCRHHLLPLSVAPIKPANTSTPGKMAVKTERERQRDGCYMQLINVVIHKTPAVIYVKLFTCPVLHIAALLLSHGDLNFQARSFTH